MHKEAISIFKTLDSDDSGFIDFKEQKITRFLIDNISNMKTIKNQFKQLDPTGGGKINFKVF